MNDPGDLGRLHDVVAPTDFPLWPLAPGLWVLIAASAVALLLLAWRAWRRYRANAYRRQALGELDALAPSQADGILLISAILKRVALVSYPREQVASLSGDDWARFLVTKSRRADATAITRAFAEALRQDDRQPVPIWPAIAAAKGWVSRHRAES